jgi:hypothetical protein
LYEGFQDQVASLTCYCGQRANAVHLIDPSFRDQEPWPHGEDRYNTSPRTSSVAVACCADHDLGPVFVMVEDLRREPEFYFKHLGEKPWRGDLALGELLARQDLASP